MKRWWRGRTHPCSWVLLTRGRAEGGIRSRVGGALGSPGQPGMPACSAASLWSLRFGAWGLSFLGAHPDSGTSRWLLSSVCPPGLYMRFLGIPQTKCGSVMKTATFVAQRVYPRHPHGLGTLDILSLWKWARTLREKSVPPVTQGGPRMGPRVVLLCPVVSPAPPRGVLFFGRAPSPTSLGALSPSPWLGRWVEVLTSSL